MFALLKQYGNSIKSISVLPVLLLTGMMLVLITLPFIAYLYWMAIRAAISTFSPLPHRKITRESQNSSFDAYRKYATLELPYSVISTRTFGHASMDLEQSPSELESQSMIFHLGRSNLNENSR
jgi:hypothetical protein